MNGERSGRIKFHPFPRMILNLGSHDDGEKLQGVDTGQSHRFCPYAREPSWFNKVPEPIEPVALEVTKRSKRKKRMGIRKKLRPNTMTGKTQTTSQDPSRIPC